MCDAEAPGNNQPESKLVVGVGSHSNQSRRTYNVTWHHPSACAATPTPRKGCRSPAPPAPAPNICEGCLPPWKPTWSMQRSTALYACNASGSHNLDEAAAYGITVYDWSHAKMEWVNNHPMNDDELLLQQADGISSRPGVKANSRASALPQVKALVGLAKCGKSLTTLRTLIGSSASTPRTTAEHQTTPFTFLHAIGMVTRRAAPQSAQSSTTTKVRCIDGRFCFLLRLFCGLVSLSLI